MVGETVECPACEKSFKIDPTALNIAREEQSKILTEADALKPAAIPDVALKPGQMIGKCRIDRKLGQGGMGAVYLAHHTRLELPVAVKILSIAG
ncbi:MAG: hypothetical protein AAF492_22715, partial [Verrucomicrobiota bacterium]